MRMPWGSVTHTEKHLAASTLELQAFLLNTEGRKGTFSLVDAVHGPHLIKGIIVLTESTKIPSRYVRGWCSPKLMSNWPSCLRVSLSSPQEQANHVARKAETWGHIHRFWHTFPQCNISEIGTHPTIQFNWQSYWFTWQMPELTQWNSVHAHRTPTILASSLVKFIASNIYQGPNAENHKINTFIVFNELKNDISRNYLLSILVPVAMPETIGRCLGRGLKISQYVASRHCADQTGILIMNHRQNTHVKSSTVNKQPLKHFKTAVARNARKWACWFSWWEYKLVQCFWRRFGNKHHILRRMYALWPRNSTSKSLS